MPSDPLRVLLIEDNPADSRLIEYMLASEDQPRFHLESVATLKEGSEQLRTGSFDAVLLDLFLPDSRGIETFQRVVEHAARVPIVAVTSLGDFDSGVRAVQDGAQDYLVKGQFTQALLVRSIRYAIERARLDRALQASRASFRSIVDRSPDGIIIADPQGSIQYVNAAGERLLRGRESSSLGHALEDELQPGQRREITICRADGSDGVGELSVADTRWEERSAYLVLVRDVTERTAAERQVKHMNEELISANAELRRLDQMKSQFLSTVSHELRTPLVAVRGYSELIASGKSGPVNKNQRNQLTIAIRSIDSLLALIDNLVGFSSMELGQDKLSVTEFNLANLVTDCAYHVRAKAQAQGLEFELELASKTIRVSADHRKIGQVLLNIIDNAIKFTPSGGKITVSAAQVGDDRVEVRVADTGAGIPSEIYGRIFERFYKADKKPGRRHVGVGIGLSICRTIVRMHGGEISVSSAEGQGSTFTVGLPVSQPTP